MGYKNFIGFFDSLNFKIILIFSFFFLRLLTIAGFSLEIKVMLFFLFFVFLYWSQMWSITFLCNNLIFQYVFFFIMLGFNFVHKTSLRALCFGLFLGFLLYIPINYIKWVDFFFCLYLINSYFSRLTESFVFNEENINNYPDLFDIDSFSWNSFHLLFSASISRLFGKSVDNKIGSPFSQILLPEVQKRYMRSFISNLGRRVSKSALEISKQSSEALAKGSEIASKVGKTVVSNTSDFVTVGAAVGGSVTLGISVRNSFLEKEKLDFEKEKLDFEKEKFDEEKHQHDERLALEKRQHDERLALDKERLYFEKKKFDEEKRQHVERIDQEKEKIEPDLAPDKDLQELDSDLTEKVNVASDAALQRIRTRLSQKLKDLEPINTKSSSVDSESIDITLDSHDKFGGKGKSMKDVSESIIEPPVKAPSLMVSDNFFSELLDFFF